MNITRMLGMQCPRLSALASAFAVSMALGLAGCSTTQKDVTAGWTTEKLYAEARDEIKAGAWDKAAGFFEKLEGRAAGTLLAQQAQPGQLELQEPQAQRDLRVMMVLQVLLGLLVLKVD